MVRTAASAKISGEKSAKKGVNSSGGHPTSDSHSSSKGDNGNPVCPRETPNWQKPITNFFITLSKDKLENNHKINDVNMQQPSDINAIRSEDLQEACCSKYIDENEEMDTNKENIVPIINNRKQNRSINESDDEELNAVKKRKLNELHTS